MRNCVKNEKDFQQFVSQYVDIFFNKSRAPIFTFWRAIFVFQGKSYFFKENINSYKKFLIFQGKYSAGRHCVRGGGLVTFSSGVKNFKRNGENPKRKKIPNERGKIQNEKMGKIQNEKMGKIQNEKWGSQAPIFSFWRKFFREIFYTILVKNKNKNFTAK